MKVEMLRLIDLPEMLGNVPGKLSFYQEASDALFEIRRAYWIYDVPDGATRGFHAHTELKQLLVCMAGSVQIDLENLRGEQFQFTLDRPSKALFITPVHWRTMKFRQDSVLMCLASELYSEDDCIRDYQAFKALQVKANT